MLVLERKPFEGYPLEGRVFIARPFKRDLSGTGLRRKTLRIHIFQRTMKRRDSHHETYRRKTQINNERRGEDMRGEERRGRRVGGSGCSNLRNICGMKAGLSWVRRMWSTGPQTPVS